MMIGSHDVTAGDEPLVLDTQAGQSRGRGFKRRVLAAVLAERSGLRIIALMALFEALVGITCPWLSAQVVDVALPQHAFNMLTVTAILVIVASVHRAWAGWLRERTMIALLSRIEVFCLEGLLHSLLGAPYSRTQHLRFGDINEAMTAAGTTSTAITSCAIGSLSELFTLTLTTGLLAVWFPALSVVLVALALVMVAITGVYAATESRRSRKTLACSSEQQQMLHTLLRAVATLRAFGATRHYVERWKKLLIWQAHAAFSQQVARIAQGMVLEGVPRVAWLVGTAWLASRVLTGDASLGQMVIGTSLIGGVMSGFVNLATSLLSLEALRPLFERVDAISSLDVPTAQRIAALARPAVLEQAPELRLYDVWFRYDAGERWVTEGVTRAFPAGEITEVRAASGAGKSTMLRLLAGLYRPVKGRVTVGGQDAEVARNRVAYLPQRSVLLEDSIATNLQVFSGQPLERALETAQLTGLHRMLADMPMGVETLVGSSGSNVSSGQSQLILLTAVFASDKPVILLDEATSQLDAQTEALINWPMLTKNKTVIFVRHD